MPDSSHNLSPLSDYSLISSLDALSISSSTRVNPPSELSPGPQSASGRGNPSPSPSEEYEVIVRPTPGKPSQGLNLTLEQMEASSGSSNNGSMGVVSGSESERTRSKSAARRERKKKVAGGERERAAEADPIDPSPAAVDAAPATPKPGRTALLPDSDSSAEVAEAAERPKRKQRRGGKRARQRGENADAREVDEDLDAASSATSEAGAKTRRSGTPVGSGSSASSRHGVRSFSSRDSSRGALSSRRGISSSSDEEEEAEVDGLSVLNSDYGTPVSGSRRGAASVMSAEDAASSIDSFLSDPRNFMTINANKLRLWQSLCVEFGLVNMEGEDLPDLPVVAPTPPRHRDITPTGSPSTSPLSTPTGSPQPRAKPPTYPFPTSLTQANKILKSHAHVNLADYLEARKISAPHYVGAYQGLLHPTTGHLRRYTKREKKFAKKDGVKEEWLQPLMRDMFVSKGRRESE
ncbi:hypothetical protein IAT38_001136 [Cryptococcus sp. DSM 104549]